MAHKYPNVLIHLVFSTKQRRNLIPENLLPKLFAYLNGIGANIELVEPFLDALDGPRAIIFDVPGVGGSPTPRLPYRPSTIARLAA